jgi:alkanesulfonate monooxygenase SsuD/methylene tetrahydromethanopterin reductase-like flavin-dependent oxidoreductase (luciferase family)
MARKVSFGLTLPNRGVVLGITTVKEMLSLSVEAEKSGVFDSIWAGDSLAAKPRLEAITLLSAVAARTERVKLGPACFASFPLRHPILLAYQWASFDVVSEGRSIMVACQGARGTGSGDSETEWAAMGLDLSERAHRLEEGIEILRKLWSGNNVSHQGRFYQFKDLTIEPKPVQNPCPIWIANNPHVFGASEKLLNHIARRVARMADGWQTTLTTPEGFKLAWERIERQAKEIGRDVSKMPRCLYYNCHINEDREAALRESKEFLDAYYTADYTPELLNLWVAMGSPQECIRTIQSHVAAGADIITIRFPARNQTRQFERFVNEVYPAFQ